MTVLKLKPSLKCRKNVDLFIVYALGWKRIKKRDMKLLTISHELSVFFFLGKRS